MRTITLEEHYATPAFMDGPGRQIREEAEAARAHPQVAAGLARLIAQLCDIGEGRITNMDAAGLDVQVLSLTFPGVEQLDPVEAVALARDTNDTLAEAVRRHPDRLAGFAAIPTPDPEAAAAELKRAVAEHGFKGALINGHSRGRSTSTRHRRPRPPAHPQRAPGPVPGPPYGSMTQATPSWTSSR